MDRITRIGEVSTWVPSNLVQAVISSYLSDQHLGLSGWIRWMWCEYLLLIHSDQTKKIPALRLEYESKRDFIVDCIAKYAPAEMAKAKPAKGGMFQWIEVNISSHPRFKRTLDSSIAQEAITAPSSAYTTNIMELMDELWWYIVEHGNILLVPAKAFQVGNPRIDQSSRLNFFRASVSDIAG